MNTHSDAIRAFVVDEFMPDVSPDQIGEEDDLLAAGVIDSLGVLQVIAWLEETFGLVLDDVDVSPDTFRSIAAIAAFVERARRRASHAA